MIKYLKLLDEWFFTFIEDLKSLRNKFAWLAIILPFVCIYYKTSDGVFLGACGLATIVLKSYFEGRVKSAELPNNGNHKESQFEQYNEKYKIGSLLKSWWPKKKKRK